MKKLVVLSLLLTPSALLAQAPSEGAVSSAREGLDPNQIICRRLREIGTRIAIRRDCMTRAQWEEHRRLTRQNVDRAQMTRVIVGQ